MNDETRLTHLDAAGRARMVDVGEKAVTRRVARATGAVLMAPATLAAIRAGNAPKGDVLGAARLAGIMAAKRCGELIPLCHPLGLDAIEVELELIDDAPGEPRLPWTAGQPTAAILLHATARVTARTGVEMEALTAVAVAGLTIYDMAKALDKRMVLTGVRLLAKSGGRSDFTADETL